MRIREYKESNYRAIFFNGKTVRQKLNNDLPFLATPTPEIEDVAINSKCYANCSYCYTSATKEGENFESILEKAYNVWCCLPNNERPFQIAIGGAGESTIHPEWVEFVKYVKSLDIVPNYTTNGMHLSEAILEATETYCGGVAVSYHKHIESVFHTALNKLNSIDTSLNVHVIVGQEDSLDDLKMIYNTYYDILDYLVVLPYQAAGRGKQIQTDNVWKDTFDWISTVDSKKFAFGALFYDWLNKNETNLEMSIYEPELFSGYRLMDDSYQLLRKSSYDLTPKFGIQLKRVSVVEPNETLDRFLDEDILEKEERRRKYL